MTNLFVWQGNPEAALARRGAEFALQSAAQIFGRDLFQGLPTMWQFIDDGLTSSSSQLLLVQAKFPLDSDVCLFPTAPNASEDAQVMAMMILLTVAPAAHLELKPQMVLLLERLIARVARGDSLKLRFVACKSLAVVAKHSLPESMNIILKSLIPLLQDPKSVSNRQGAALAIHGTQTIHPLRCLEQVV